MEKLSDYIFRHLADAVGVRHVFMLPGGGCMHLVDSLGRNDKLEYICNLHEQASAIGAEACAQYTNNLGVTLVTAGPGSTNAITGVAGAWIDSTPLLVLSGQAKREDLMAGRGVRQMGIQEVDIVPIVAPVTKYAKRILDPETIRYELEKAVWLAMNGRRGPVWLDIPLDVQAVMIDPARQRGYEPEAPADDAAAYRRAAEHLLAALRQAKRPVIYAGNGIRLAGAVAAFVKLIEKLQIPVLTSWKAADFLPEDHPLFVGRPGIIAQRGANFVQQTADCLIALGTRLDLCQTGFHHPGFAPRAKKIVVDLDPAEIGKLDMRLDAAFALDAGKLIAELDRLAGGFVCDCPAWLARAKDWQRRYPAILPEYCDESKPEVNLYHLIAALSDRLTPEHLIVPGSSGACAEVTMQAIKVKTGERILNTPGLGSMGFGLPAAIGACLAAGRRETVSIVGDGGLQHNIQELQTLKRLELPVKLFILNNGGYGSIVNMQKGRFAGHFVACNAESGLTLPDLAAVAAAYQLRFERIATPKDLNAQVGRILAIPGPVLCEVIVDPAVPSAPRLISEVLPDGRIVSRPMEELFPPLPPEEFAANMAGLEA